MALDPATIILTDLAVILLIGLVVSLLSRKLKMPNILLLILSGIILGEIVPAGSEHFHFASVFLVSIAVLTLAMVVFDGSSRFDLKNIGNLSVDALKITMAFLIINMVFVTLFTNILFFHPFSIESLLFSLLFSFVMTGTDPGSVFILLKSKANRVIEILEIEAIANTPITVIFPFIIIDILNNLHAEGVAQAIVSQFVPFLQQVVVGVGAGMVIGIIVLKTMKTAYSHQYSPVGLITAALLAYILAENLGGNGVLAVATLGLLFGNVYVKEKATLQEFNSMLNSSLVILVFILIGLIIEVDFSPAFLLKALGLFIILILSRLTSINFSLRNRKKEHFNVKEKLFMALSMPKGIAIAVVVFSLSVFSIAPGIEPLMQTTLQLILVMMVYSLVLSAIIDRFSYRLIRVKLEEEK